MDDQVRTALRDLVSEQGEPLLSSSDTLRGLLAASFPDRVRENDALTTAVEAQVPSDLRDYSSDAEARTALGASALRLERGFQMDHAVAAWAVLTLAYATGRISEEQFRTLLGEMGGEASVSSGRKRTAHDELPRVAATPPGMTAPPVAQHPPPPPRPPRLQAAPRRTQPPPRPVRLFDSQRPDPAARLFVAGLIAFSVVVGIFVVSHLPNGHVSPAPRPAPREQRQSAEPQPLKVPGNIQEQKLILQNAPEFPEAARDAGISGVVTLNVVIAANGGVRSIELASGPPLLAPAAIKAVAHWQYQPTLVDGRPVEVSTQIDVVFKLTK
ncbi:MAG TPA: energy transducer TonB [Bryobacteraceae bacterium]|nr:energy transducer TonB [Bryobacteraceae bacterium]